MSATLVFAILVVIIAVLIPNPRPRPRRRRLNLSILDILTLIPLPIRANDFPPLPTPPPTSLAAAQLLQQNSACATLSSALSLCTSRTPGFTTLPPTQQASCLCYTSSTYAPTNFDDAVKTCADYAITAVPNAYTPILNLEGFCAHLGPASFLGGDSTSICTTTSTSTSAGNGNGNGIGNNGGGGGGCNLVSEILSSCTQLTPSFLQMQSTDQASCLCYASSTIWQPGIFDSAVATCISAAPGSSGMLNSAMSSLGGFCAGVGNVLASSTIASAGGGGSMTTIATTATGNGVTVGVAGSGSWNGQSTTMDITVTIGGLLPQQTGSGNKGIRKVKRQEVVGISFVCALVVTFLW